MPQGTVKDPGDPGANGKWIGLIRPKTGPKATIPFDNTGTFFARGVEVDYDGVNSHGFAKKVTALP